MRLYLTILQSPLTLFWAFFSPNYNHHHGGLFFFYFNSVQTLPPNFLFRCFDNAAIEQIYPAFFGNPRRSHVGSRGHSIENHHISLCAAAIEPIALIQVRHFPVEDDIP